MEAALNSLVMMPAGANLARVHAPARELAARQESFAAAMGRASGAGTEKAKTAEERAREAAEQFVTQAFILPILKKLRESNNAAAPFAPSKGERPFRALEDAELAQRITHASHFPLVDRLARDLLRRSGASPIADVAASITPAPIAPEGVRPLAFR